MPRLSRGSLEIGAAFITKILDKEQGILKPNESVKGEIKVNIENSSKFTPYIILTIDYFNRLDECEKGNNDKAIDIR